jgi:hypothetical protein
MMSDIRLDVFNVRRAPDKVEDGPLEDTSVAIKDVIILSYILKH